MLDKNSEFCYAYRLLPKEEFSPAKVFVLISAKSPVGSTMTQRFSCFHCAALLLRVGLAGPTAGTRGLQGLELSAWPLSSASWQGHDGRMVYPTSAGTGCGGHVVVGFADLPAQSLFSTFLPGSDQVRINTANF